MSVCRHVLGRRTVQFKPPRMFLGPQIAAVLLRGSWWRLFVDFHRKISSSTSLIGVLMILIFHDILATGEDFFSSLTIGNWIFFSQYFSFF